MIPTDLQAAHDAAVPEARLRFVQARYDLTHPSKGLPYFSGLLFQMGGGEPVWTAKVPTAGVDKYGRLYINALYFAALSKAEAAFVEAHECLHPGLGHFERVQPWLDKHDLTREGDVLKLINYAQDAAINQMLRACGLSCLALPEGVIFPETIGCPPGWTWEAYADHLLKQAGGGQGKSKKPGRGKGKPGNGQGQGQPGKQPGKQPGQGQGQGQGQPGEGQSGSASGDGDGQGHDGTGAGPGKAGHEEGSGGNDTPADWEIKEGSEADASTPKITPGQWAVNRQQIAEAVKKSQGRGAGVFAEWADSVLKPAVVPWDRLLSAYVRQACEVRAGNTDPWHNRPGRRVFAAYAHARRTGTRPVAMAGTVRPIPDLGLMVDSSGSMWSRHRDGTMTDLEEAGTLVESVTRHYGASFRAWVATDGIQSAATRIGSWREFVKKIGVRSGGTDMVKAITEACARKQDRPDIILLFSDGYTDWPSTNPVAKHRVTVICVLTEQGCSADAVPAWAHPVKISKETE